MERAQLLGRVLPAAVSFTEAFGRPRGSLFPAESALIERAGPRRSNEFRAARLCAHGALELAGWDRAPVLRGRHGQPAWPSGLVGSITHCAGYTAAAVAPVEKVLALGIDAEPAAPLPPGVLSQISSPQERTAVEDLPDLAAWGRVLFSAKESIYKAWSPAMGRWLGFDDARVSVSIDGRFRGEIRVAPMKLPDGRALHTLEGRWTQVQGLVITAVAVLTD